MNRRAVIAVTLVMIAAISGLTWLNAATPRAAADATAPQMSVDQAAANTSVVTDWGSGPQARGTAEWTVSRTDLVSNYPNGFTFDLEASSSGGAIVSARVEWTHRAHEREGVPLTVRRADGEIDPATGTITATWTPSGSTAVPPWVAVNYRWLLRDEAGNEYTTDSVQAEYTADTATWSRQESDDVLVFWTGLPDNMGDLVVQAMQDQHQKYVDGWGAALPYRPRVILFGDVNTWLEWQVGHQDTTGLGVINVGLTSDDWGGTVQVLYGETARNLAYGTVLHETEHLYQGEFLVKRISFTPGWFIEGDATFYQRDDIDSVATSYVNRLVASNDLPLLLQGDGPTIVGANSLDGYYIGYTFFKYLDLKWGISMHRQIMDLLAANTNFYDAIAQATGLSVEELESNWRSWLGASGAAPTLVPTWTPPAFLPTPTLMQFGTNK